MKKILLITAIGGSILLQSCATILSGSGDRVYVKSGIPADAKIYVDGNFAGKTPDKVKLSKNSLRNGAALTIKAPGYKDQTVTVKRKVMVGYVLLDLVLGLVPLAVDFATGAIYKATPGEINYELETSNTTASN